MKTYTIDNQNVQQGNTIKNTPISQTTYQSTSPQYQYYQGNSILGSQNIGSRNYQTVPYRNIEGQVGSGQVSGQVGGSQVLGPNSYTVNYGNLGKLDGSQLGNQLITKQVLEQIPVQSRIEYIPFEKKYIEYDQIERVERVPVERIITQYEEIKRTERVPIQRMIQDYYAVEYQIEYIPKIIEEKVIEYVQQERQFDRVQYLPIETQIIHYPEAQLTKSQVYRSQNIGYNTGVQKRSNINQVIGGQVIGSQVGGQPYVDRQTAVRAGQTIGGQTYADRQAVSGQNIAGGTAPYGANYDTLSKSYGNTYDTSSKSYGNNFYSPQVGGNTDYYGVTGNAYGVGEKSPGYETYGTSGGNQVQQGPSESQVKQKYYTSNYQN